MLTSIKNPLIKKIRRLHYSKYRKADDLFLLEGSNLVAAAYTQRWQEKHPQLSETLLQWAPRVEIVSEEVFNAIALTKNPAGVVAIAPRLAQASPSLTNMQLGLILEQIQDPGNMGTIIRTAVATGVEGIWGSKDSVDFDHPKVLRASVGAWFRLGMGIETDLPSLIQQFHGQVIATVPTAKKTYWEVNFQQPTLILLGNEGAGLSDSLAMLADEQVTIPIQGEVESLNVAIATALILYEAKRQRLNTC